MSRYTNFQFRVEREGRVAQMNRQEEVIARKRQEIIDKQKTSELAKQVVAAQCSSTTQSPPSPSSKSIKETKHPLNLPKQSFEPDPIPPKNLFSNDGSFFENFKKITEAAKKIEKEKQQADIEKQKIEEEKEQQKQQDDISLNAMNQHPVNILSDNIPEVHSQSMPVFSTNSMPSHQLPVFNPNMSTIMNLPIPALSIPPPPPPPIAMFTANPSMMPQPPLCNLIDSQQDVEPQPAASNTAPPSKTDLPASEDPDSSYEQQTNTNEEKSYSNEEYDRSNSNSMQEQTSASRDSNNQDEQEQEQQQQQQLQQQHQQQQQPPQFQQTQYPQTNYPPFSDSTSANRQFTIPKTIDGLIKYIAENGDDCEGEVINEMAYMNERVLFRFLKEKDSAHYDMYREKVLKYREDNLQAPFHANRDDKYDPEEVLLSRDYDDDKDAKLMNEVSGNPIKLIQDVYDDEDSYDSDSEYMQEAKERNLENMKRKIDNGGVLKRSRHELPNYYSSDEDNRVDERRESAHFQSDDAVQYESITQRQQGNLDMASMISGNSSNSSNVRQRNKKRSRWGECVEEKPKPPALMSLNIPPIQSTSSNQPLLTSITRTDPQLLNYARQNYGTTNLSEEDWRKCEEHYKVNLLYQNMLKKREEIDRLARSGRHKYEYDSDEDINGGTWEHKLRNAEMEATAVWAEALNKQSEGKHHIGDFLPPEELKKFMEIYKSKQTNREPDLSDYKEYKLKENNKGFQMLQKLGWNEGQGLGADGNGIVNPINKAPQRDSNQGLGTTSSATPEAGDNEYDAYRKRMMLAYRFRPNPLNNPRRAYY